MLIVILLLTMIVPVINPAVVFASETRTLAEAMDEIITYYENNKTSLDSWEEIIALSNAGVNLSGDPWQLPDLDLGSLDSQSPAVKYSSTILAMEALGQDPTNIDGRNLLAELSDMQEDTGAFPGSINNTIWSIIALDSTGGAYQVNKAINYLIAQQTSDGGFALSGGKADPDITGLALLALSTHIDIPGVTEAINQIKDCLKEMQLDSGGFGNGEVGNTESIASIIRGLTAIDEDITLGGWIKNEKTMIDALFALQLEDYSFSHTLGSAEDDMATRQALIAVSALLSANILYNIGPNGGTGGSNDEQGVRVRVEGATASLSDTEVTVTGTALDALKAAVGADNLVAPGGFVSQVLGESGVANIAEELNTSWHYYVLRNGNIEAGAFSTGAASYNIEDGDEVVFYIGADDAVSWEGKTYFPLVSINPASPNAGQTINISIKAQKYDWMLGLQDLNVQETETIGDYILSVNGQEYTSNDGKITIPFLSVGVYEYSIANTNDIGYPDVVTYKGAINVANTGDSGNTGGSTDKSIRVYVAIVGSDGELLFSPRTVSVYPDDTYGLTAVGALDATGLSWDYTPGLVTEIEGQQNQGMNGWMYKINNKALKMSAFESSVKENDQVIWWYSYDPNSEGPSWKEVSSGNATGSAGNSQPQSSQDMSQYSQQLEALKDNITIVNADKRMSSQQAKQLEKELGNHQVSLHQEAKVGQDTEIMDGVEEIGVFIPAGAVSESINITVEEISNNQPRPQFGIRLAGSVYEIGPDGSSFDQPLTIIIRTAITDDLDIQSLSPAWYDTQKKEWIPIPALLDLEHGLVVFRVDHFTPFAVLEFPARSSFDDLGRDWEWAREAIEVLAGQGIINGTGRGFEPARPISRAEFVQLLVKALNFTLPSDAVEKEFNDIQAGDWYAPAVWTACANDVVGGYPDGSFKPHKAITRNEMACVLHRLHGAEFTAGELDYCDKDAIPAWAQPSICFTAQVQLIKGYEDGSFRGYNPLTRAEAAVIVYRYLNYLLTI
jgi:hypothetical protein